MFKNRFTTKCINSLQWQLWINTIWTLTSPQSLHSSAAFGQETSRIMDNTNTFFLCMKWHTGDTYRRAIVDVSHFFLWNGLINHINANQNNSISACHSWQTANQISFLCTVTSLETRGGLIWLFNEDIEQNFIMQPLGKASCLSGCLSCLVRECPLGAS